ncbi:hypothetical protein [Salipiger pallidus]|nr:hypothetical protein [Salipiger pallidus]
MRSGIWAMILLPLLGGAAGAEDVAFRFTWEGGNGYEMTGALSFDSALLERGEVREGDLTCFVAEGTQGGASVGRWALGMRTEDTTWHMTFLPQQSEFAVFGPRYPMPQAWNMDGFGTDCGAGGFGFNIGNAAQDLCIDGALVVPSQVPPDQPFPAVRDDDVAFPPDACIGPMLMSRLEGP